MINIPGSFAKRYLWTMPVPDLSTPEAHANHIVEFRIPTGFAEQISSLVSFAFDNTERGTQSDVPFLDAPLDNKAVVLACSQSQGAQVIDTAIKQAAFQQGADVLVLDAFELARGRFGALGQG